MKFQTWSLIHTFSMDERKSKIELRLFVYRTRFALSTYQSGIDFFLNHLITAAAKNVVKKVKKTIVISQTDSSNHRNVAIINVYITHSYIIIIVTINSPTV